MLAYLLRRLLLALVTIWAITVVTFVIIQLPPGDFVDAYVAQSAAMGSAITMEEAAALRQAYGLDEPLLVQYVKWVSLVARGEFGVSFEFGRPVIEVIGDRLWLTILLSIGAIIVTWGIALPIGIYSAVRQYSWGDYFFTFVGFIGLAVPNFLLALIVMYLAFRWFGLNVGGLFSAEFELAPWSAAKVWDLTKHLPLPVLILALSGTAQLVRIMRANLLDELRRPYVVTARAKGLPERRVILKYPVRAALNPFASTIGYLLPFVVSGSIIVSVVLSLPTVGPLLLRSLVSQDMLLASSIILLLGRADGGRHLPLRPAADVDRSQDPPGHARMSTTLLAAEELGAVAAEDKVAVASQLQLTWWRFRRHRLAVWSGVIVALFYLVAVFADFLATTDPHDTDAKRSFIPPQAIHWFDDGPVRAPRFRAQGHARPAHLQAGLHAGPEPEALSGPVRARLRLQPPRPVPDQPAPARRHQRPARRTACSCSAPTCWAGTSGRGCCWRAAPR